MTSEKVKEILEKYIRLCSWYLIKDGDKDITSGQFTVVLNEIGKLEDKLREMGVSENEMAEIVQLTKKNALEKPIREMSDKELLEVCKLIFGNEVEFEGGYTPQA